MKDLNIEKLKPLHRLEEEYTSEMAGVAVGFLTIGLDVLLGRKYSYFRHYQVALANLCIGIELLARAYLAKRNLSLILTNVRQEIRALLICPEATPNEFRWESFGLDLKSGTYRTAKLGDILAQLYAFRPDLKPKLHAHTRFIQKYRSVAVHGLCPSFEHHAAERAAFTGLELAKAFAEEGDLTLPFDFLKGENGKFLVQFDEKRIERVKKALEVAKETARKSAEGTYYVSADGWESRVGECPICDSDVLLDGYTEHEAE